MANYKVIYNPKTYQNSRDVEQVIQYLTSPDKALEDGIIGGAVLPENAADAMNIVTDLYYNERGPRIRHSVLSFSPHDPLTFKQIKAIARSCVDYYKDQYQIIATIHKDCDHPHIHFAMCTTSHVDGSKYPGTKSDYFCLLKHLNQTVKPYGISVTAMKNWEDETLEDDRL